MKHFFARQNPSVRNAIYTLGGLLDVTSLDTSEWFESSNFRDLTVQIRVDLAKEKLLLVTLIEVLTKSAKDVSKDMKSANSP